MHTSNYFCTPSQCYSYMSCTFRFCPCILRNIYILRFTFFLHLFTQNKATSDHSSQTSTPDERTILKKMCPAHPPAKDINRKVCMQLYRDSCYRDADCAIGSMCCYDGCVYKCTAPVLRFMKGQFAFCLIILASC